MQVVQPNTPLASAFEPASPFSFSTTSCSSNSRSRPSLPASPRSPVPRRSTISHGPNGSPSNLLSPPRTILKSRSVPNFAGITRVRRKHTMMNPPSDIPPVPRLAIPARTSSPAPSIILTSPESPRGSTSSISLFSSSYEESETSYSSSSDRDSVVQRRPPVLLGPSAIHEAHLRKLTQHFREEPLVPDTHIPNHIVNDVFDSQVCASFISLLSTLYLHASPARPRDPHHRRLRVPSSPVLPSEARHTRPHRPLRLVPHRPSRAACRPQPQ